MHALIEARDLSCGYQGSTTFSGLNFSLQSGQFAGLVGPSGSGKTTLIKSLLGLVKPQQGGIYYQGRPLTASKSLPKIGYVPQVETVDWNFPVTAAEVVMMGRYRKQRFWPWPSKEDRDIAHHLLERIGAADIANRAIGSLSGGQQQRVFLARALVGNPDLVLLDEPTSSADIQTQHELLHLLWDLNDQGVSILLSTHDLNSVATHLPWVVCFNHGILAQGKPTDVLTSQTLSQTFGGDMVVQHQGEHVLIANKATTVTHPVQRPRPVLHTTDRHPADSHPADSLNNRPGIDSKSGNIAGNEIARELKNALESEPANNTSHSQSINNNRHESQHSKPQHPIAEKATAANHP